MINKNLALPVALLTGSMIGPTSYAHAQSDNNRPNILLILCDDMGYSDIGCYGSEINTPNLDQLASEGIRFTQFYNTARSCPSRASLMTGLHPHETGIGHMTGGGSKKEAYQGFLNDKCITLAEVLGASGYTTNMSGKWHMGTEEVAWPYHRGFQNVYAIHNWVDSYWRVLRGCEVYRNDKLYLSANPPEEITYRENGSNWYTTDVFTDEALKQIESSVAQNKPFFSYVAYNAPHWPLEAHDSIVDKYIGKYSNGWEPVMNARLKRLKDMGIIDKNISIGKQDMVDWNTLSADDRENLDFRRAIYAAQVEILDFNIGRLVAKLKEQGVYENTVIVFLSDNGCSAEPEDVPFGYSWEKDRKANYQEWKRISARTGASQGKMWSIASDTPFRMYKKFIHEGGISTPFIISYPSQVKKAGRLEKTPCYLPDIMATFVDLAGANYPTEFNGHEVRAMRGRSIVPVIKARKLTPHKIMTWEHEGHGGIRMGDWKLVTEDIMSDEWELYNMKVDRTEMNDLSSKNPKKAQELKAVWDKWAREIQVLPK